VEVQKKNSFLWISFPSTSGIYIYPLDSISLIFIHNANNKPTKQVSTLTTATYPFKPSFSVKAAYSPQSRRLVLHSPTAPRGLASSPSGSLNSQFLRPPQELLHPPLYGGISNSQPSRPRLRALYTVRITVRGPL
jgi:hypothetical protein